MSTSHSISAATASSSAPASSSSSPAHKKPTEQRAATRPSGRGGAKMDDNAVWHADAVCAKPVTVRGDFIVERNSYLVHEEDTAAHKTDGGLVYRHIKFLDIPSVRAFKSAIVRDNLTKATSPSAVTVDDVYTSSANPIIDMEEGVLVQTRFVHVTCNDEFQSSALARSSHAASSLARIWLCNRRTNPRDASFAVYPFEQVFAIVESDDGACSGLIVSYDGTAIDDYVSDAYHATEIDAVATTRGMFEALLHLHCCGLVHNSIVPRNVTLSSMAERILLHEVATPPANFESNKYHDAPSDSVELNVRLGGFASVSLLNLGKEEICLSADDGHQRTIPTFPGLTSGLKTAMPIDGRQEGDDEEESVEFTFKSPELLLGDNTRFNPRSCDVYGMGMIVAVFLANHVRCVDKEDIDPYFVSNGGRFSALHDIAAAWGACSFPPSWVYPSIFDSPGTAWHRAHLKNPFLFQRWTYDQAKLLSDAFSSKEHADVDDVKSRRCVREEEGDDGLFAVPSAKQAAFEYETAAFMNAHRISPFVATPDEVTCSKVLPGYVVPSVFHFYTFMHSLEVVCNEHQFDTDFFLQAVFSAGKIASDDSEDQTARSVDAFVSATLDLLQLLDGERPAMGGTGAPVAYVGGPARNMIRLLSRKRSLTKMTVGWWFAALNMLDRVDMSQIDDETSARFVQTLLDAARRTVNVMRVITKSVHPDVAFRSNALDIVNECAAVRDGQCFGMCRFSKASAQMSRNSAHAFPPHPSVPVHPMSSLQDDGGRRLSLHAVTSVVEKLAIAAISNCPGDGICDTTLRVMVETVLCFRSSILRNDTILQYDGNDLRVLLSQMCIVFSSCLLDTAALHGCVEVSFGFDADELLHSFNVLIERFVDGNGSLQFSELVKFVDYASSLDSLRNNKCVLSMASRQLWVKIEAKLPPLSVAPNWLFNPEGKEEPAHVNQRHRQQASQDDTLPLLLSQSAKEEEEEEAQGEKRQPADVEHERYRLSSLTMKPSQEHGDDEDEPMIPLDEADLDNETIDSNGSVYVDDVAVDLRWLYAPNAADDNLKEWIVSLQEDEEGGHQFSNLRNDELHDEDFVDDEYYDDADEIDYDNNDDVAETSGNTIVTDRRKGEPAAPVIASDGAASSNANGIKVTAPYEHRESLPWLLVERFCETTDMLAAAYHAFLHNALNSAEEVSVFLSGYQSPALPISSAE